MKNKNWDQITNYVLDREGERVCKEKVHWMQTVKVFLFWLSFLMHSKEKEQASHFTDRRQEKAVSFVSNMSAL